MNEYQSHALFGAETIIEMDKCASDGLEKILEYLMANRGIGLSHREAIADIIKDTFEKRNQLRRDWVGA